MSDKKKKKFFKTIVSTLKIVFKNFKAMMLLVAFLSIISGYTPIISLKVNQLLINSLQMKSKSVNELIVLLTLVLGISIIQYCIEHIHSYYSSKLGISISYLMNYKLMKKAERMSLQMLESPETYDMLTRLESEVTVKPFSLIVALTQLISIVVTLVGSLIIIMKWSIGISFIILGTSILFTILYIHTGMREFDMRFQRANSERKLWYISFLLTHDVGFKEVKLFNLKNHLLEKYKNTVQFFVKQESKILFSKNMISTTFSITEALIAFIIGYFAVLGVFSGDFKIGTALMYISSIALLQNSIKSLADSLFSVFDSYRYMDLYFQFDDYDTEKSGIVKIKSINSIELCDVNFSYRENIPILRNLNLKIKTNNLVSVVGENGSGKSTLLKLLLGLYKPTSGKILVNGINIDDLDQESYFRQISCIFQDFLQYQGSLEENVRLGNIDATVEQLNEALAKAQVDFLKDNKFYNFDAQLGSWFEGGQNISGGQWQKIALSRFFVRESSMNILDEPSSAIDKSAETKMFQAFLDKSSDTISLYVTHRINLARKAKQIIVLKDGEILSVGSHEQLLNNCEYYKKLFSLEVNEDN